MDFEMQVIWSNKAKITYFKILDYLKDNWTKREIAQFAKRSDIVIQAICKNPKIFSDKSESQRYKKGDS